MTEALLEAAALPATGAVFFDWSIGEAVQSSSRIYLGPGLWVDAQIDFLGEMQTATDPGAQRRSFGLQTSELAKNLSEFVAVAELLIPGLREMTLAERGNLRQYYKRVYRKV